ncbi:FMN-binding negative transcriptional regulator [bacterium]|nr:FMN-binding negative transcriptional regulator [bacterium]
MYIPKRYEEKDAATIREFIKTNNFATVVSCHDNIPVATHLPLDLVQKDEGEFLYGHFSKANTHWKKLKTDHTVLAIFTGPHAYISPQWYDHMNVPTWNYTAVHVYGKPMIVEKYDELYEMLRRLIDKHETRYQNKYTIHSMTKEYLDNEMKGIVGFKIKIEKFEAAFKLSQNRHERDYENIVQQLSQSDDTTEKNVAEWMKKKNPHKES